MKLTAHRLKDRVHLQDLIGVGQIDKTWPARFRRNCVTGCSSCSTRTGDGHLLARDSRRTLASRSLRSGASGERFAPKTPRRGNQ